MRLALLTLIAVGQIACAPSSKEVRLAKATTYDATYDEVWNGVVAALATDYPSAMVFDKEKRRIVTCWRPVDRPQGEISTTPGSGYRLYRTIVEISAEAPYRVMVSGRAGTYQPPQIVPIKYGEVEEPGWVGGRTDRVILNIAKQLKGKAHAQPAEGDAPKIDDPLTPDNVDETCVIRATEYSIPSRKAGIIIDPDRETGLGSQGLPGQR